MSYRTFKRLLGETSLERKCRLLLGGVILVLILMSFFLYGYLTEKLVRDQTQVMAQVLVDPYLFNRHWAHSESGEGGGRRSQILDTFDDSETSEKDRSDSLPPLKYTARLLRRAMDQSLSVPIDYRPFTNSEDELFKRLQDENVTELYKADPEDKRFYYVKAVRLKPSCLTSQCHPTKLDEEFGLTGEYLKNGGLHSAASLSLPSQRTDMAINVNRAVLISIAFFTAIVAMIIEYVIVRYVIVKPAAHLKEVSEEIAAGNLAIRSNIQTGDEFQELSQAFNRMLRSLVSMQDELRRVNTDLDHKLDELAQANMALFEMNRLKSEFLATISHELRTPLNSILGFGDILAESQDLSPTQQRWVENILTSGRKLLGMINDILDLAKLEAGKMQVNAEEFSLRDLVEGSLRMTRPLADRKNIAQIAEIDPLIPILRQDASKLQQILDNLLSNAIKFTPEGGQIVVSCKPDRAHVVLSVTDNGVGIAPADQQLVFDKFRQADSTLTRSHGGTGLGLSIVRELVKLLGGDEVALDSELGRGSSFTIRIPMHYNEQQQLDLSLGTESFELSKARETEVRYYSSKGRAIGVDPN